MDLIVLVKEAVAGVVVPTVIQRADRGVAGQCDVRRTSAVAGDIACPACPEYGQAGQAAARH